MKTRTYSYDFIRILACILVITVHVSALFWGKYDIGSSSWVIANAYDCLGIIGVPLFFMLSGSLLLNPDKVFSIKKFSLHHTLKIFIAYMGSVFFFNTLHFLLEIPVKSFVIFKEEVLINSLSLTGYHLGHLWFLPSLLCLYLLTPILRKAFVDKNTCLYMLLLFFFFGILFHTIMKFDFPYHRILFFMSEQIPLEVFLGYAGYYCLGHYITYFSEKPSRLQMIYLCILSIGGYLFTTIGCHINSSHIGEASAVFNEPFSIGQFLTSASLYAFLYFILASHKPANSIITILSKLTFPIYLFHPAVLLIMEKLKFPFFFCTPILAIPINVLLVFLCSTIIGIMLYFPFVKKSISPKQL